MIAKCKYIWISIPDFLHIFLQYLAQYTSTISFTLILLPMIGSPLYIIIYIVSIITYILYHKFYEYGYLCEICKRVVKLKCIPLYCVCMWAKFGEKIKLDNDLTKADCGKCSKGHPLTSIDSGGALV